VSANSGDTGQGPSGKGSSASAERQSGDNRTADGKGTQDAKGGDSAGKGAGTLSQAEQFKAFVEKNGSPQEKKAVAHVTTVLDAADVYTDFTGGLMGEGAGPAKLIASAFADWKQSKNGLVTVYDANGELLGNGEF